MSFLEHLDNSLQQELRKRIFQINNFIANVGINLFQSFQVFNYEVLKGKLNYESTFEYLRRIIWACLPIATLTVSASAFIYSLHIAPELSRRGLTDFLGGLVALAMIREGVPVMASLAIISQFCSGISAQIASMKVTEQIDAMKVFKVKPVSYILVPLLIAGFFGFSLLCVICTLVGIMVNYVASYFLIEINYNLYFSSIFKVIDLDDLLLMLVKASVFGFVACLISYICGMVAVGGAKAVGSATRLSVVINFILVVVLDYVITALWL